ncbi:hypothetical protein LWI29_036459 [Acer saccharum]|uniref:Uncharacterized protein n=1 Tax=Acer saccharum TaxID=4024 RepID=A0AA39SI10_ACESA|nr:hypothetical protein LWI29_036459 [Acer saccharum]
MVGQGWKVGRDSVPLVSFAQSVVSVDELDDRAGLRGSVCMACQETWAELGLVRGGGVADQVRHGDVPRSGLQDDGPPDRPTTAIGSGGSQEVD